MTYEAYNVPAATTSFAGNLVLESSMAMRKGTRPTLLMVLRVLFDVSLYRGRSDIVKFPQLSCKAEAEERDGR